MIARIFLSNNCTFAMQNDINCKPYIIFPRKRIPKLTVLKYASGFSFILYTVHKSIVKIKIISIVLKTKKKHNFVLLKIKLLILFFYLPNCMCKIIKNRFNTKYFKNFFYFSIFFSN